MTGCGTWRVVVLVKIWLPDATLVFDQPGSPCGTIPVASHHRGSEGKATGELDYLQDPENAADEALAVTPADEVYAPLFLTGTQEAVAVGEVLH